MALKIVRRYDANGRELTEANLNREGAEGIRQREKKGDD